MDVRTVHSVNSLVSCVLAMFLNLVLLWLVLKRAPKEMQVYSRILIQTILVDIALTIFAELTQLIVFMDDGWVFICLNGSLLEHIEPPSLRFFLEMSFVFFYFFSIHGLAVQFLYRYLVLAKGVNISMPRYLAMLCVPASVELATLYAYKVCGMPTPENEIASGSKAANLLGDPIYLAFISQSTDVVFITNTGFIILTQIVCYTLISVSGYKVSKYVRENSKLNPAHKEMNRQLTLNLIIQAITPGLLCAINISLLTVVICFPSSVSSSLPFQVFELLSIVPMHWLPVFNPLVTMAVVKPFRRTLLCVKTTNAVAKPVVAVPVRKAQMAVPKKDDIVGRQRVATVSMGNSE